MRRWWSRTEDSSGPKRGRRRAFPPPSGVPHVSGRSKATDGEAPYVAEKPSRAGRRVSEFTPSSRQGPPRLPYMPGVDGLRALAVAAVVIYHLGASWLPGGFLGVDVFLVISGYLITSLLLAEHRRSGRIELRRFWLRRARRLLPALFVMIVVVLAVMVIVHPGEVARLHGAVLASFAYVANWYFAFADVSYFEQFARPSIFQHLWSLAVEEQFYLLWPPVIALGLVCLGRRWLLAGVAVLLAGSTALAWVLWEPFTDPSRIYYGTDTRAGGSSRGSSWPSCSRPARLGPAVRPRGPHRARRARDRRPGRAGLADAHPRRPGRAALSRRLPAGRARDRGPDRRRRPPLVAPRAGLRRVRPRVAGGSQLRHLPLALAGADADPGRSGRPVRRAGSRRAAGGADRGRGRPLLPLRRAPLPPARIPRGPRLRSAAGAAGHPGRLASPRPPRPPQRWPRWPWP